MKSDNNKKHSKAAASNIGRKIIIGVLSALLGCILLIGIGNLIQVHKLKQAALTINVGDFQVEVEKLLGQPKVKYWSGYNSGSSAPTKHGSCYGGCIDFALEFIDGFAYMILKNHPQWYHSIQDTDDWPVVVEYDMNDVVIKVNKL